MECPWQHEEAIQAGTDYRDPEEVSVYDERTLMLRDVDGEVKDIRKALSLSKDSTVWERG